MPLYNVIEEDDLKLNTVSAMRRDGLTFTALSARNVVAVWLNYMLDGGYVNLDESDTGSLIVLEEGKNEPSIFSWTYKPPEKRGDIHVGVETEFEVEKEEE